MRVIVVDDEGPARRRLGRMLGRIDGVEVVGEAADAQAARQLIAEHRPDLVVLDIHMPEEDGLSLASWPQMPSVIFVTAHDEHAIRAFELAALDYLLKPVTQERLEKAVARVDPGGPAVDPTALADALRAAMLAPPPRLTARSGSTLHVLDARQIGRLSARDKYCVVQRGDEEYLLDESLAALERRLAAHEFVRVHRGELVNLVHVVALHGTDAGSHVELRDGSRVPVSRRLLPELRRRLSGG